MRELEPAILGVVDLLIDHFASRGRADLVSEFAEPLPAIVIGRMIGLDQPDADEGRRVAAALFASIGTDEFGQRMSEFAEFTRVHVEERRRQPREDFLTQISTGVVEGMEIDDQGAAGLLIAYIVGGHHSTGSGLAGLLRHILTVPGLREQVVDDPKNLQRAVEESLRLTTPREMPRHR